MIKTFKDYTMQQFKTRISVIEDSRKLGNRLDLVAFL